VTTASGKALRLSDNPFMFKDVKVKAFAGKVWYFCHTTLLMVYTAVLFLLKSTCEFV
jgi:hypothetical protein